MALKSEKVLKADKNGPFAIVYFQQLWFGLHMDNEKT